jgi:hypothetical protein
MTGVKSFMARAQISGSAFWKRESKKKLFGTKNSETGKNDYNLVVSR